jgi:hypothetical protein
MELPVYNTPEKNVRAAEAITEELSSHEGEELRRQTRRVAELLHIATEQQKNPRYADNAPSNSLDPDAADHYKSGPRDTAVSSSPHPSRHGGSLGGAHAGPSRRSRHRESPAPSGRTSQSRHVPSREQPEHSTDEPAKRRPHRPAPRSQRPTPAGPFQTGPTCRAD